MVDYFEEALGAYRDHAAALAPVAGAVGLEEAGLSDERLEQLLEDSQALERAAAQDLDAGDADVREAAAAKLAAAAALDVAAASDLLKAEESGSAAAALAEEDAGGSAWARTYDELADVLGDPAALGARTTVPVTGPAAAALAEEEADPVAALRTAANDAIRAIAGDAQAIAEAAIGGLAKVPADALASAFGSPADKLIALARAEVTRAVRWALRFIAKAVSKLLRLLGRLEPVVRRWLRKQLERFTLERIAEFLLDRLLGVGAIRADVEATIEVHGAGADARRLQAGAVELEALAQRFGRHRKVVVVLAKLLGTIAGWLVTLAGWVAAAIAGVLLVMLAYGVWVAGDFLDWFRTRIEGRLDLVAGVRAIVALAVGLPDDAAEAPA